MTSQEKNDLISKITLDLDNLKKALSGRKGLRTKKPTDNLQAYLWRMIRFHGGIDVTMPIMCTFDLRQWVNNSVNRRLTGYPKSAEYKAFEQWLDCLIDAFCVYFKLNPYRGALAWKGLLY